SRTSGARTADERRRGRLRRGLAGGPRAARAGRPGPVHRRRRPRDPTRWGRGGPAARKPAPRGGSGSGPGPVGTQGDALLSAVLPGGVPAAVDVDRADPALLPARRARD